MPHFLFQSSELGSSEVIVLHDSMVGSRKIGLLGLGNFSSLTATLKLRVSSSSFVVLSLRQFLGGFVAYIKLVLQFGSMLQSPLHVRAA